MADGRHHGSLTDTGPTQGAAPTGGQDLAALDLAQLMGLDVIPSAGANSQWDGEDRSADLMDLDLDQLMGLNVAPLPRSNTDAFDPLPPASFEGTFVEDVIADASGGDDGVLVLDEPGADPNHQGPQGEEASLDLVGLDLETLMEIAVGGIGRIEDIASEGDASLDGGAEFDVFDLGTLAPALGQPLSQFSAGPTGGTTGTSPVVESDESVSGGDTTTTTTDPTPPSPPNNAPAAAADGVTTNEDTAVGISVLANDSDVDGDSLSVSAVTQGANGTVVINGDNTVTYTPNVNFNGADSFTYTVDDGNGGSDTATVNVTVTAVNDAPTTNNVAASGAEDAASIAVTLAGGDVDGTVQSFALSSLPANGTLYTDASLTTLAATGTDYAATAEALTLYFVPAADWNGATSFDFAARDDGGASDASTATATITVTSVNDAPVAVDDAAATAVDTAVIISVLANDTDPDTGDTLSITGVTQGTNGTVVDNGDGTVTYTPNLSFTGSDSFTYTADDGQGGSDTGTVTVSVDTGIMGTSGDDTLSGTNGVDIMFGLDGNDDLKAKAGDDTIYGGDGNDTLNGQGGSDALFGGAGDDILVWDSIDTTIDGGSGTDTLNASGADVDITTFAGALTGIEQIDLSAVGNQSVTLTAQDVLDISDTNTVTVVGGPPDTVDAGTGWTDGGIAGGFHTYTQGLATLLVDTDVAVNGDITT
jgi:hypothetical protein